MYCQFHVAIHFGDRFPIDRSRHKTAGKYLLEHSNTYMYVP